MMAFQLTILLMLVTFFTSKYLCKWLPSGFVPSGPPKLSFKDTHNFQLIRYKLSVLRLVRLSQYLARLITPLLDTVPSLGFKETLPVGSPATSASWGVCQRKEPAKETLPEVWTLKWLYPQTSCFCLLILSRRSIPSPWF